MEWSFFVTEDALKRLQPNMRYDEASVLRVFDDHRDAIYVAAARRISGSEKTHMNSGPPIFDEISLALIGPL